MCVGGVEWLQRRLSFPFPTRASVVAGGCRGRVGRGGRAEVWWSAGSANEGGAGITLLMPLSLLPFYSLVACNPLDVTLVKVTSGTT